MLLKDVVQYHLIFRLQSLHSLNNLLHLYHQKQYLLLRLPILNSLRGLLNLLMSSLMLLLSHLNRLMYTLLHHLSPQLHNHLPNIKQEDNITESR